MQNLRIKNLSSFDVRVIVSDMFGVKQFVLPKPDQAVHAEYDEVQIVDQEYPDLKMTELRFSHFSGIEDYDILDSHVIIVDSSIKMKMRNLKEYQDCSMMSINENLDLNDPDGTWIIVLPINP